MKTIDFPAGHSMDTEWFAVDKNGNIGVFDSGPEGAVPIENKQGNCEDWLMLLYEYATPITPALKQLYLNEKTIERLLHKCNVITLERILTQELIYEGYILLLSEGKTWVDLNFEHILIKEHIFAFCLSPVIPLYFFPDIYNIEQELYAAIRNKIIAKACCIYIRLIDKDSWDEAELGISDLGLYLYESNVSGTEPYVRISSPEFPLKANQISPNLADKIPYFKEISFENQNFIQPMEFKTCCLRYENEEAETIKITASNKKEVYCLNPVNDPFYKLMNLNRNCYRCDTRERHCYLCCHGIDIKLYQEYPPIIIIEDNYFNCKNQNSHELLYQIISNVLNVSIKDYIVTFCIKCFIAKRMRKRVVEIQPNSNQFQKCYTILSTEISVLRPLLLIAINNTTIDLLKTKYEIRDYSETPCLCSINVEGKQYSMLVINNVKTKKEQASLEKYLSTKSDEIKNIMSQPRNLSPPKQRVIRIEEDDD